MALRCAVLMPTGTDPESGCRSHHWASSSYILPGDLFSAVHPGWHTVWTAQGAQVTHHAILPVEPVLQRPRAGDCENDRDDQLKVIAPYSGAAVLQVQGDALVVLVRRAPGPDPNAGPPRYPLAESGPFWAVLTQGKPIIIDDLRGDSPLAHAYQAVVGPYLHTAFAYERSWLAVPMVARDRVIGVISLSASEPGYFTAHHADLAMAIAQQSAIAIENAQLYEQAQELATLEERQRLARDLHDSVSQAIFGIRMRLPANPRSQPVIPNVQRVPRVGR